jgi:hypothetical protein
MSIGDNRLLYVAIKQQYNVGGLRKPRQKHHLTVGE